MRTAFIVDAIRRAEFPLIAAAERSGDPDAVMRRAAAGVARSTASLLRSRSGGVAGRRVLLLVGAGDNGGDALYAGRDLRGRGCAVDALVLDPARVHERGFEAFRRSGGGVVDGIGRTPDVAVDGVVGLGGRGPLRAPAARAAADLARLGVPVVAVDLPSGVDADTGETHQPHVTAAVTVTFGALRRAHLLAGLACGETVLVDIGLGTPEGPALLAPDAVDVGRDWPVPGPDDDKYTQGVVAVRAGSARYPGAGVLCTSAAVAATSGMVRFVGDDPAPVLSAHPEVVCSRTVAETGRAQAWVVGPGAGTRPEAVAELDRILGLGVPTLLDADALTCVAEHPSLLRGRAAPVLLTPHAGEFARLAGSAPDGDRAGAVRRLVGDLRDRGVDATVLLKGRTTVIDDGTTAFAVDAGSSWAATAGSGDVLSGLAGALLAAGAGAPDGVSGAGRAPAGILADAAVVHGLAARTAAHRFPGPGVPVGASALLAALPAAIGRVRAAARRPDPRGVLAESER